MKKFNIVVYSKNAEIDPNIKILGISQVLRCIGQTCKTFSKHSAFAPIAEKSTSFNKINIISRFPNSNNDILLIDPCFIYENKLAENLVNKFTSTAIACDQQTLLPLGLAYISSGDITSEFINDPWGEVLKTTEKRLNTRVVVVAAKYVLFKEMSSLINVKRFLLNSERLSSDGTISRNLNRFVSLRITSFVSKLPLPPLFWTILTMITAAAGCLLIFGGDYTETAAGALLVQFSSILSGVDGEIARLKFQTSKTGKILDYLTGYATITAMFAALTFSIQEENFHKMCGQLLIILYLTTVLFVHLVNGKRPTFPIDHTYHRQSKKLSSRLISISSAIFKQDSLIFIFMILALTNVIRTSIVIITFLMMVLTSFTFSKYIKDFTSGRQ